MTPQAVERALAASWPALEVVVDGAWEARFAKGYSGRSNSIQCFDRADHDALAARLKRLAALYRDRGLPPCVKITPLTPPALEHWLDTWHWVRLLDALVLTMAPPDPPAAPRRDIDILAPTDPVWLDAQQRLQHYKPETRTILEELVTRLPAPSAGFLMSAPDGTPLASALCVLAQGVAVPLNVITDPARRGQGLGRAIMAAALAWSARHKAQTMAIQVRRDNAPAIALYQRLGFRYCFSYHYRRAPEAAP